MKLSDGTLAEAVIVGADSANDLAVLRSDIDRDRLEPATLGDSDSVRPGDFVFASGNPFSFEFTVTLRYRERGQPRLLSTAVGRPIRGVIQTDAAVNPGNTGGPFFNLDGEVIGINTAIENPSGQRVFVGIGLAVPSNTALRFLPDMIGGTFVRHPQLGIQGVTLNEANAADAGVSVSSGVYVVGVAPGARPTTPGSVRPRCLMARAC